MKHPLSDIIISLSLCLLLLLADLTLTESSPQCKAWLVQSIPTDMPHLSPVPGVLTTGKTLMGFSPFAIQLSLSK
jgi:phospholipase D3/4